MDWKQPWIDQVLAGIPAGSCRGRMEAELRDHLETLCGVLMGSGRTEAEAQAEALRSMGEPASLREEYRAAWRRSLPERRAALRVRLRTWARGCAVMFGVQLLVSCLLSCVWQMALSLPGDSQEPWVRLIRGTVGDLNNSWLWILLPLVLALTAGAYFLGRRFQTSRRPAGLICAGLSLHWAFIFALDIWWEALDDHQAFWEELRDCLTYGPAFAYRFLALALCVLLGVVFGRLWGRAERSTAA